jgi:hypothetical protein
MFTNIHLSKGKIRTFIACAVVLLMLGVVTTLGATQVFASGRHTSLLANSLQSANNDNSQDNGGNNTTAIANLYHTPVGAAQLFYDKDNQQLTVTIRLTGLQPKSEHMAHIHFGTCANPQMVNGTDIAFPLNPITADANGIGRVATVIKAVQNGIPNGQWYINVHQGPGMTGNQATSITCGNIVNPNAGTFVLVSMGPSPSQTANNQNALGMVRINLVNQNELRLDITIQGLVPGSTHADHIHQGTCSMSGAVLYPLPDLTADDQGNIIHKIITITLPTNLNSIPRNQWVFNMHNGTMAQLGTQVGYDPVLCGEVDPI